MESFVLGEAKVTLIGLCSGCGLPIPITYRIQRTPEATFRFYVVSPIIHANRACNAVFEELKKLRRGDLSFVRPESAKGLGKSPRVEPDHSQAKRISNRTRGNRFTTLRKNPSK